MSIFCLESDNAVNVSIHLRHKSNVSLFPRPLKHTTRTLRINQ